MKLISTLEISALLITVLAQSDPTAYRSNAVSAFNTLQQTWYNTTSGLWNTCGWWNGANVLTGIANLASINPSIDATSIFTTTYANAPPYNPGAAVAKLLVNGHVETTYGTPSPQQFRSSASNPSSIWLNSYYDDNAWWALAWISVYDLTQNSQYLSTAEGIFANLSSAWPTRCGGGGIPWSTTSNYVNAIANELFLSTAAHLATRVSDANSRTTYLDWAKREWTWFQSTGMINNQGVIIDGLTDSCAPDPKGIAWSYNQGVILSGLAELSRADTANANAYLSAASNIATAALANLTDSNGIIHDICEATTNGCGADGTQFKGIFMRGLTDLWKTTKEEQWKNALQKNAQSIWNFDRDAQGGLGVNWASLQGVVNASTHSSALEAIIGGAATVG